jgi:outer membrane protein TolC
LWEELGDVQLNQLEEQALINSPNVKIAAEKVNQARASFNSSSAVLFPQLSLSGRLARIGISEARPVTNDSTPQKSTAQTDILPQMLASYELDLWGRVSSLVAVGEANLESSMADFKTSN